MRLFRILPLFAAGLCLAQSPAPTTPREESVSIPIKIEPAPMIPKERVVLQVGDIKLTAGQVDQILLGYPESQRVWALGPGRDQFVEQMVRNLVLSEEGRRRKLTETEVFKTQLAYNTNGILANLTDEEVRNKARSDESLIKAWYEAHKADYEQIHAHHILIRMQGSPLSVAPGQKDLTDAEALAKIQDIRQKIQQGAPFAALARTDSDDMGSSAKGGDLGWVKRGQAIPSFEEAAFSLPVGELSQPVKTTYGYHLIKVEERKPAKTYEELRPELEKNAVNDAARQFVEALKAKTKILIDPDFKGTTNTVVGPGK